MLNMIKGAEIDNSIELSEGYEISNSRIVSNVDADHIRNIIEAFIHMNYGNPLFLFIEVPTNLKNEKISFALEDGRAVIETPHKDIYYLDGISADALKEILEPLYEVLINDGISAFGIGNPSGEEIGKYKYNMMVLYSPKNINKYVQIFEQNGIEKTNTLVTAWDAFTKETPGTSRKYEDCKGRDIYDIIEVLSEIGLYKYEQREE